MLLHQPAAKPLAQAASPRRAARPSQRSGRLRLQRFWTYGLHLPPQRELGGPLLVSNIGQHHCPILEPQLEEIACRREYSCNGPGRPFIALQDLLACLQLSLQQFVLPVHMVSSWPMWLSGYLPRGTASSDYTAHCIMPLQQEGVWVDL